MKFPAVKEKDIYWLFRIGLLIKAIDGVLECLGAVLLFLLGKPFFQTLTGRLMRKELFEDPHDLLVGSLVTLTQPWAVGKRTFVIVYLLLHGVVKLFVAINVLQKRLWAYPVAIVIFSLFICYQLYRFTHTHSYFLIFLSVFDFIVSVLIWHEYKYMTKKHQEEKHMMNKVKEKEVAKHKSETK